MATDFVLREDQMTLEGPALCLPSPQAELGPLGAAAWGGAAGVASPCRSALLPHALLDEQTSGAPGTHEDMVSMRAWGPRGDRPWQAGAATDLRPTHAWP